MEVLMCIICFIFVLMIFIPICNAMDSNKNKDGYNIYNSSAFIQCDANEKCDSRFSFTCDTCKHNCGIKKDKNCYEKR